MPDKFPAAAVDLREENQNPAAVKVGLPPSVLERAKAILARLESDDTSVELPAPQARPKKKNSVKPSDDAQLNLL
jgi:DNA mismatch repair ATPase MutS